MMFVSRNSSSSRSLAVLIALSRYFLRPSVIGSRMRDSRMALKMSLFPSMATKWQLALQQVWTEAPTGNQESNEQKNKKKQSQGHNRIYEDIMYMWMQYNQELCCWPVWWTQWVIGEEQGPSPYYFSQDYCLSWAKCLLLPDWRRLYQWQRQFQQNQA